MFASRPKLAILVTSLFVASTHAEIKPYINTTADVRTECKTCPYTLCTNKSFYDYYDPLNVTCWTHGTEVVGDPTWLKTDAGCYVTQYHLTEYPGDYTEDLPYCGSDSEKEFYTVEGNTVKYKTECLNCPELTCGVKAYLSEDTDVELTCWVPDGYVIIDDPYWLKTTENCYVARKNLWSAPDLTYLDPCGPIPFLEPDDDTVKDPTNSEKRNPEPEPIPDLVERSAKYLVNVTIGEEYSYCRTCAAESCEAERRYEFNQEVYLQCLVILNTTVYWSMTTDFCYINNADLWQSPQGDFYRFPECSKFDGDGKAPGDEDKQKR
ncbi:hypothetical protein DE146DRAFT_49831 [Phaeosphaeria sp. MPI-PUGE-AT-0046c]|nr:hypothetical protein DE146DRAFT_49831 [Phaeosphaeria sp. MPI-PUGE-AT-0046c]